MSFYLELQLNNNVQTTQSSPLSEITQRELAEFAASPAKHSFPLPFRNFCHICIVFHPTRNFSQQRNNPLQLSTAFDNGVSYLETETHQLAINVYQLASNLRRRDARVYARKCITQRRVYLAPEAGFWGTAEVAVRLQARNPNRATCTWHILGQPAARPL